MRWVGWCVVGVVCGTHLAQAKSETGSCDEAANDDVTTALVWAVLALINLAMGLELHTEELRKAMKFPVDAAIGLCSQSIVNPFMCYGLIELFDLSPEQKLAALLLCCSPGGGASNFASWLAGGNVALSVLMTTVSTTFSFFMMPFLLWLFVDVMWGHDAAEVKFDSIGIALAFVVVPAAFGVFLQVRFGRATMAPLCKLGKAVGLVSFVATGVILLFEKSTIDALNAIGGRGLGCALLLNIAGVFLGIVAGTCARRPPSVIRTIAIEVGTQNIGIPLAILVSAYDPCERKDYLTFYFAYALLQSPVSIIYVVLMNWAPTEKDEPPPIRWFVQRRVRRKSRITPFVLRGEEVAIQPSSVTIAYGEDDEVDGDSLQ